MKSFQRKLLVAQENLVLTAVFTLYLTNSPGIDVSVCVGVRDYSGRDW